MSFLNVKSDDKISLRGYLIHTKTTTCNIFEVRVPKHEAKGGVRLICLTDSTNVLKLQSGPPRRAGK